VWLSGKNFIAEENKTRQLFLFLKPCKQYRPKEIGVEFSGGEFLLESNLWDLKLQPLE